MSFYKYIMLKHTQLLLKFVLFKIYLDIEKYTLLADKFNHVFLQMSSHL